MNEEHPLVEAMKRKPSPESFAVDLPDAQVGDEVKFVVKAIQGGKAVLEAQRCDEEAEMPPMVMTQNSNAPS